MLSVTLPTALFSFPSFFPPALSRLFSVQCSVFSVVLSSLLRSSCSQLHLPQSSPKRTLFQKHHPLHRSHLTNITHNPQPPHILHKQLKKSTSPNRIENTPHPPNHFPKNVFVPPVLPRIILHLSQQRRKTRLPQHKRRWLQLGHLRDLLRQHIARALPLPAPEAKNASRAARDRPKQQLPLPANASQRMA